MERDQYLPQKGAWLQLLFLETVLDVVIEVVTAPNVRKAAP